MHRPHVNQFQSPCVFAESVLHQTLSWDDLCLQPHNTVLNLLLRNQAKVFSEKAVRPKWYFKEHHRKDSFRHVQHLHCDCFTLYHLDVKKIKNKVCLNFSVAGKNIAAELLSADALFSAFTLFHVGPQLQDSRHFIVGGRLTVSVPTPFVIIHLHDSRNVCLCASVCLSQQMNDIAANGKWKWVFNGHKHDPRIL